MPQYDIAVPGKGTFRVNSPTPLTNEQAWQAVQNQVNAPEPKSAGFSLKDLALSFGQGVGGGTQAITDIAGAGNVVSKGLTGLQEAAGEAMSPERQAEILRRQEIKKKAEGNTLEEIKAVLGGFAEAPLQTLAQGAGSIVPMVLGTALMPAAAVPAAVARLTAMGVSAGTAAKVATSLPASTIGAMMGVGGQKGQDYETVKRELLEKKIPEEEAERLAQKAAEYSLENAPRQLASGAAGALAGGLGVESLVGRIGKKLPEVKGPSLKLPEPTVAQAIGRSTAAEALPEGLQSAVSTVGTNVALNQAGVERDLTQGVLANALNDALVGGVLGAGASPLKLKEMRQQYVQDEFKGQQEYQKQQQEEIAANQKKIGDELSMTQNPLGMLTVNDLGADLFKTVQQHRTDTGKPALTSFSLDDVVDALPGKDKAADTASLNAIIAAKTGYTNEVYTPTQIIEAAQAKNVETGTQGFDDFLVRTTGLSDPAQMSQPQLHAAVTALAKLPGFTSTQSLPEGLNATNYTPEQFTQAIDSLNTQMDVLGKDELTFKETTNAIETATGLKGSAVNALINDAARKGDVVTENKKVSVPSRTTPTGYGISEEIGSEQEQATSYEIRRGDEILDEYKTKEAADEEIKDLNKLTAERIKADNEAIKAEEAKLDKAKKAVQELKLAGNRSTPEFQAAQDAYEQATDEAFPRIAEIKARQESYEIPLTVVPIGVKKVKPKSYVVRKGEGIQTVKQTREEAEQAIFEDLSDADLQELSKKRSPALQKRVNAEIQRRAAAPAKAAPATATTPEQQARLDQFKQDLPAMLERFGLKDVGLKIVDAIEGGAEGSYQAKLIQIALSAEKPIQTLRHEAIHALKELGFFTPQQWAALRRQAQAEWVQKYLKDKPSPYKDKDGNFLSRYDAYKTPKIASRDGLTEEDLIEEAIADAFADWDSSKAPGGMLTALLNKMRNFFAALKSYLNGRGFQTYKDVFGKIEAGELKPSKPAVEIEAKLSLAPEGIPQNIWDLHEKLKQAEDEGMGRVALGKTPGAIKRNETMAFRRLNQAAIEFTGDNQKANDLMVQMNEESSRREEGESKKNLPEGEEQRAFKLNVEREQRKMARSASLTEAENAAVMRDAEELGLSEDGVDKIVDTIIADKKRYPATQGWADLKVIGITSKLDENGNPIAGKEIPKYAPISYAFNVPPGAAKAPNKVDQVWLGKVTDKFQKLVEDLYDRANSGDATAKNIIAHQNWYKNVAATLRQEYGAFGDTLADLLGATSPNTPVDTNWRFSIDVMRRFVRGDFDAEMSKFVKYLDSGKAASAYPTADKITQITGKLYGMNSTNAMLALSDMWRAIKPNQAPKARNFALNLIGQSNMATIDVWAARMLRRAADMVKGASFPRIPPPAEQGVTGKWNADATKVTGAFGFGADVMQNVSDNLAKKGINIDPPDLQAIAWFAEKELWTKKNWTNKAGEGGSFEENIEGLPTERYIAGHSIQVGETQPKSEDIKDVQKQITSLLSKDKSVIAFRAAETSGLYGGTVEKSFDTELVVEKGKFDPEPLVERLANISKENNQYDIFISKVVGPKEENLNARPGVEIYFKTQQDMDKIIPILKRFTSRGQDGFTLAVDPRLNDGTSQYVGVRLQYVPEISMRWDEGLRQKLLIPGQLERILKGKAELLESITAEVSEMEGVAHASVAKYDTLVIGKENYDDYTHGRTAGKNQTTPEPIWFGEPVRKHVERAVARLRGDTGQVSAGNLPSVDETQGERKLSLPLITPEAKKSEQMRGIVSDETLEEVQKVLNTYKGKPKIEITDEQRSIGEKMLAPFLRKAEMIKPRFTKDVNEIADAVGGDVRSVGLKSMGRSVEKMWTDTKNGLKGEPSGSDILDLLRTTIVVENESQIQPTIDLLTKKFGRVEDGIKQLHRIKDRFTEPLNGYRDILTNVKLPNGLVAEIQINVPTMILAKNTGHVVYAMSRALPEGNPERTRLEKLSGKFYEEAYLFSQKAKSPLIAGSARENVSGGTRNVGSVAQTTEPSLSSNIGSASKAQTLAPSGTLNIPASSKDTSIKESKKSLKTNFETAEEAENAAYRKAPPTTPEFKRFFGRSVAKEEGRPQVMYHASMEDFPAFRENRAIFVSPDPYFVEDFIQRRINESGSLQYLSEGNLKNKTAKIYPVWVRAEKPFDYENPSHVRQVVNDVAADFTSKEKGGRIQLATHLVSRKDLTDKLTNAQWDYIEDGRIQEAIKKLGFDSFYTREGGAKNLALYNSNQVKSVTGNTGEFGETKDMRFSLNKVKDEVDTLPNGAAINASINRLAPGREQKGYIERILELFKPQSVDALRQQFLNRYNQLGVYDKRVAQQMGGAALLADSSAESAALMSDNAAAIATMACGIEGKGGIPVFDKGYTTISNKNGEKGVLEILMPLAKRGDPRIYQTYQFWAGSLRGSRLLANGTDHTYTKAEIDYAKELLVKYPEFKQVQEDWIKYNNGLMKYAVETGVLSPEKAAEFMKYSDYIPFYRQIDGEKTVGPRLFQNISGVTPPKKLKGLKEEQDIPFADFLETIVRNTQSIIQSGMKNTAAQRAIGQAVFLKMADKRQDVSYAPGVVTVLENGKPVSYDVADQLFIDAVKSLNLPELPFLSFFAAPANLLRNLVTKDPGFMMANLMRDSLSAWVTSGAKMTPIASTIANFGRAIGGTDPVYIALRNAGVIGGYEFAAGVENSGVILGESLRRATGTQTGTEKALKPFTSLWRGLEKGTEASDAATRMAVYKATLEKTGNEAEAIYRAMEVMNFNRKGNLAIVRILTAAVPFLNARMQGLDVFYRAAFGKMATADAAAIQKSFFIRGATLMALTSMYWFLTHDEEEYLNQEQETRDNNWLFPSAGIRIPIPFEVGVLFKVVPERILEYSFGSDTGKDMADSFKRNLINTFAFNPIPQTVLPFVEARTNYSFFTMRPIVGQGMENVAKEYQMAPNTSEAAKKLGGILGESPIIVDHIMKGYTGSLGMYAIDLIDAVLFSNDASPKPAKRFEQMPVIKRFIVDKEAKGTVTAYYDLKNSVDEVVRTVNLMERTGNVEGMGDYIEKNAYLLGMKGYISSVEKQMKVLREAAIQIRSSDMSPEEKRESLSAITQAQNAMTANIREIKKSIQQ
jgi:hypothetical protein